MAWRQTIREVGLWSRSAITDRPVAVNPLIDSKTASTTSPKCPLRTKGMLPTSGTSSQVVATMTMPSPQRIGCSDRGRSRSVSAPRTAATPDMVRNQPSGRHSAWRTATAAGMSPVAAMIPR